MISIKRLVKYYGDVTALNGIDLEIRSGEILGFLGPNGAGKTTTLKVITCYTRADAGEVTVAGLDVNSSSLDVRRKIGYLPETCPLYADMRVLDFIQYIAELRSIPRSERNDRIDKVVTVCGLGEVLMKGIGELSKGYRQRTGLAQALVDEPDILLLDEPTSGLDPNQIIEIRELIKEIGKEKTVVLSTHILPEVSATCDRVAIIHRGQIVADGTPEDLQKSSKEWLSIRVRLRGKLDGIQEGLANLPDVESVRAIASEPDGETLFDVRPVEGKDLTAEIYQFAVKSGVVMKELRIVGASLEDVFHKLTQA
jgi:ABC-2 type transport system ATP-binding protein